MSQFENVTVLTQANVYFDGKCVSHTIVLGDGSRKTLGVLMPSRLNFSTDAPERMEITSGTCRVRLDGETEWTRYVAGDSFSVRGGSRFDIEALDVVHYVCHLG